MARGEVRKIASKKCNDESKMKQRRQDRAEGERRGSPERGEANASDDEMM